MSVDVLVLEQVFELFGGSELHYIAVDEAVDTLLTSWAPTGTPPGLRCRPDSANAVVLDSIQAGKSSLPLRFYTPADFRRRNFPAVSIRKAQELLILRRIVQALENGRRFVLTR